MAVRLEATLTGLHVRFSGADLVAAFSRGLFLPYTRILGARVMTRADAVASSPRFPCPGLWWSRRYRAGCWGVGERRQLWSAREGTHVVVIYLTGRPFHRVVVDVDQPEQAHRRIDAALLHSKKTGPRRSIRRHRRSANGHADLGPARADGGRQQHPGPNRDRVPAHAAPRRTAPGEQPHSAAPESASAERTASGREASSGARTPAHGSVAHHTQGWPATELSPSEIDPDVAARLRLYRYREGERAKHGRGSELASTRRGSNPDH